MPLESCMILLDNSQYMLNGDYIPTRLSAQADAANLLVTHKTQSNPESTVGVIAMSGGIHSSGDNAEGVELLVSPTDDMGKILNALHKIPIRGRGDTSHSGVDVPASVQVASLALKHRRNKNGQQRIVIFVGSPLGHVQSKALIKAGKTLKKNNVAIDVVSLGELEENEAKLKELVDAANGTSEERTCNLVSIPAGTLPSDVLIGSPIIHGGSGGGGGGGGEAMPSAAAGGGDTFADYGGVDPNMDPELAMALRVSMEEERARQERLARERAEEAGTENEGEEAKVEESGSNANEEAKADSSGDMEVDRITSGAAASADAVQSGSGGMMDDMADEDALLQQALAMSMAESQPTTSAAVTDQEDSKPSASTDIGTLDEDEDVAMQMALRMSMQAETEDANSDESSGQQQQFQDPQFVNQLLGSLPGVDQNDPAIRSALENLQKSNEGKEDDKKKDGGDDSKK
jgi:26S proteasome regulatory subunit N10